MVGSAPATHTRLYTSLHNAFDYKGLFCSVLDNHLCSHPLQIFKLSKIEIW